MRAWWEATAQVLFEGMLSVFRFRWRSADAGRRGQSRAVEDSQDLTVGSQVQQVSPCPSWLCVGR